MSVSFPLSLVRPQLLSIIPYDAERVEADIVLDANESTQPPYGRIAKMCAVNRYAEPQPLALRERMGRLYGVSPDQILLTRGGDEGIDMLVRLFCSAGQDSILVCPPTFSMYASYAGVQGAGVQQVPLKKDGEVDVAAVLAACGDTTKIIFIPNPAAPLGCLTRQEAIADLARARAGKSIVVADEAYIEFSGADSMTRFLAELPNLVIIRTLSKAHALAGERVGAVVGAPELIFNLRRIVPPYPLTQSSILAALETLSPNGLFEMEGRVKAVIAERQRLSRLLPRSPFVIKVWDSAANFLYIEVTEAAEVMARLARYGIRVRDRKDNGVEAVRLSIGTRAENDAVLRGLGVTPEVMAEKPQRLYSLMRKTNETDIAISVNLDEAGRVEVSTGLGFFDHMLCQIAQHGKFSMIIRGSGDSHVDPHHLIEDCALVLGEALAGAIGDKRGIGRYGFTAPLDEALASVALDLSGRPTLVFEGTFPREKAGEMPTDMVEHFFRSLATKLGASVHISIKGDNAHHMIEACFKAFGRALSLAVARSGEGLPSTKGVL